LFGSSLFDDSGPCSSMNPSLTSAFADRICVRIIITPASYLALSGNVIVADGSRPSC
jgi:hypothetical protein